MSIFYLPDYVSRLDHFEMKEKQIRVNNSSPLPLRLKIIAGYVSLLALLGIIVFWCGWNTGK